MVKGIYVQMEIQTAEKARQLATNLAMKKVLWHETHTYNTYRTSADASSFHFYSG